MPYINIEKSVNLKKESFFIKPNGQIFKGGAEEHLANNTMEDDLGRIKGTDKDNKRSEEVKK